MEGETSQETQEETIQEAVQTDVQQDTDRASRLYAHRSAPETKTAEPVVENPVEEKTPETHVHEASGEQLPPIAQPAQQAEAGEQQTEHPQTEAPADPPEAQSEEAGEPISSWSQLVEHMEWDPEWADSLTLTKKVNGEEREVSIGELLKVDQTMDAAQELLADAKEKRKTILEETTAERESQAQNLAQSAALLQVVEDLLGLGDGAEAQLQAIRKEKGDAAYLVAKDERETLQGKIDAIKEFAAGSIKDVMDAFGGDGMTDEERTEKAQEEHLKLVERVPEWADEEVRVAEVGELVGYLSDTYEYTADQIKGAVDHKLWDMARKAMKYDQIQAASKATKKEVKSIPMKGGSSTPAEKGGEKKDRVSTLYGAK